MKSLKWFILTFLAIVLLIGSALGGALADRLFVFKPLDVLLRRQTTQIISPQHPALGPTSQEENVIAVVEKASASVVTVSATIQQQPTENLNPFDPFGMFGNFFGQPQVPNATPQPIKQDIGSGFVVDTGIIVTNKHVVSDTQATYKIIASDNKEYPVKHIYRDPQNDLAILQIDATLPTIELGDSSALKVGQSVIAIGTALGQFRHTVTTGVISGLGRGISAGDGFTMAEKLDNVIQTDAAINPGNSGGPLLNSSGQVIGVNVAVAQGAQNIGFALPINVIKDSLKNFNQTGKFSRPFVGVSYKIISQQEALLNDVVAGAYVVSVIPGSSADKAGLKAGDIITSFGGVALNDTENNSLTTLVTKYKVGDTVQVDYIRNRQKFSTPLTLQESTD